MNRAEITKKLQEAATYYFVKKLYAVHHEFGIERWGRRRLDMLCMDFKTNLVAVEIKSCLADYRSDLKWRTYLPHVDKMYFLFPPSVVESKKFAEIKACIKAEGVGILTLRDGKIRCIQNAKTNATSEKKRFEILVKMAWRGGDSKRNIKRTKKVFLE